LTRAQIDDSVRNSVRTLHAALLAEERSVRTSAEAVWSQMETAAGGASGMRASADVTGVTAAMTALATRVDAGTAQLNRFRASMDVTYEGLNSYARLYVNMTAMLQALATENVTELHRLRAEHNELLQAARGVLGRAEVFEHVRTAWQATRAHWTGERIQEMAARSAYRVVHRQVSAEFRALLSESLARQMRLNQLAAEAAHGVARRYGPNGVPVTPVRTRIGGGVLAAIEVARIGLDMYRQYDEAQRAMAEAAARSARAGVATLAWWLERGVQPTVALARRDAWSGQYELVSGSMSQEAITAAAVAEHPPEGTPEFEMVVVTAVPTDQLLRFVRALVVALANLEDWNRAIGSYPQGPVFEHFDEGWGVLVFHEESHAYRYVRVPAADADLDRLQTVLAAGQEATLALDVTEAGGQVFTARDTAIFGVDREVTAYTERGYATTIDFEDFEPRFVRVGVVNWPARLRGPLTLVRAADMRTYRVLSRYWWVEGTGQMNIGEGGTWETMALSPNSRAQAYIDADDLRRVSTP
jgi:hypothetical protein